jgi:hypothetical protein
MPGGLASFNRALSKIPRRAEQRDTSALRETFVDSGVAEVLDMVDHQVLYGRRGTGKTHALAYLVSEARSRGDVALYIDLRTVGSPDGVFNAESASLPDRATRLLVDMLGQVRDGLLDAVIEDEELIEDAAFVDRLDGLLAAITNVKLSGEVERSVEAERKASEKDSSSFKVTATPKPGFEAQLAAENAREGRDLLRETRRGTERISLNFSDVSRALRELARTLSSRRVWLVLDEWSSVSPDVQPYLAEFLVRCVLPLQGFTVKIAAIEQQSRFRASLPDGNSIGIELGADVGAHIDLDEFMVFEQNEEQARAFFAGLFYKHLTSGTDEGIRPEELAEPSDVIRLGFTDTRAFDELVRAAEGVPRDAIYIAAKAAMHAGSGKISVPLIRSSARSWYQTDKAGALRNRDEAQELLKWIIDKVIREKRARGFLVNERHARDPLLLSLFDARVLHIVRRGYSAQDQPGERFDVWVIDYGAYIDLIQTKYAPRGVLPVAGEGDEERYLSPAVPVQDLRAIRRAVLELDEFQVAQHVGSS